MMIKQLKQSLDIDTLYTTNSFIFLLRKLPILKDLITDDIYASRGLKRIIQGLVPIYLLGKMLVIKFFYYFLIFSLSYYYFPNYLVKTYYHVLFILTILGMFINNKMLNTSKKNYFSLLIFKMEATSYFRNNLWWNQIENTLLNTICIVLFNTLLLAPIKYTIMLILLMFCTRLIGEAGNMMFYKKYHYIWYSNTKLYGTIMITFLLLVLLPFLKIFLPLRWMISLTFLLACMSCFAIYYLMNVKDYKQIYQKLSHIVDVMNSKNDKDYLKQAMVEVRDKDKIINHRKLKGKKGYDYFNTIFFERHKEILIRSAKKYCLIGIGVYIGLIYLMMTKEGYSNTIKNFLENRLGWFVVIMYFVNRGAIVTQAMFFNCDHAMLTYNFYRTPKAILELFKKRLETITKVNLLPAFVIGIGNMIVLTLAKETNVLILGSIFIFVIMMSILFSIHYLVIYYLMQPFNKDLEVKKASYSFATLATYIVCYQLANTTIDAFALSVGGILFTIIYGIIALKLVYHYAPKTFKLN